MTAGRSGAEVAWGCPPALARALHDDEAEVVGAEAVAAFDAAQVREGLVHGRRPLCPVLSPLVLSERLYRRIERASLLLLSAAERVVRRALGDPGLAAHLGVGERERALHAAEPGAEGPSVVIGRLDLVLTEPGPGADPAGAFAFLELNAESPAGLIDQSALEATLFQLPPLRRWLAGRTMRREDTPAALLAALRAAHRRAGGDGRPRIAIVDWRGQDTAEEQARLRDRFIAAGTPTVLADPDELRLAGGRLHAGGGPVDLVYRRVIGRELLARADDDHPLLRAVRAGAVVMANPLRSAVANRKALFGVLSDPAWAGLFSAEEQAAINQHLPWTRILGPEAPTGLRDRVLADQERLVIKPNDDYGGRGVVLGWTVDAGRWEAALGRALREGGVVQERAAARRLPFPMVPGPDGQLRWETLGFDCDPFLLGGQVAGAVVRVSSGPLSNVSAGGGVTALVVLPDPDPEPEADPDDAEDGLGASSSEDQGRAHV